MSRRSRWVVGCRGVHWDELMDDARLDARLLGRRVRVIAVQLPPPSAEIMGIRWAYVIDNTERAVATPVIPGVDYGQCGNSCIPPAPCRTRRSGAHWWAR